MPDQFYYSNGKKISLVPSTRMRAIQLRPQATSKTLEKAAKIMAMGPAFSAGALNLGNGITLFETPAISRSATLNRPLLPQGVQELTVFEASDGSPKIVTEDFVVQFRPEIQEPQINSFNQAHGVSMKMELPFERNTFILHALKKSELEVIALANLYMESGLVNYAHPDFVRVMKQFSAPNDTLFKFQWSLYNTGQNNGTPGQDINISGAWAVTQGSPNILIAVLDTGVDYNHPDLNVKMDGYNKLVQGYDALSNSGNQQPLTNNSHGTACAGIATAGLNNKEGVVGVAPACRLFGVRLAVSNELGKWSATESQIATGIKAAVAKNADVLSCSWGGGDPSDAITQALLIAKTAGRQGKGCVVVFAAGNENKNVNYPANLNIVLTVTACNEWGERKSPTSRDNERWWGSNFGPEVDVCAPGVHICTTTNAGQGEVPHKNYMFAFRGTSAAAPIVAGVSALILSVNPQLKAEEVERILKYTATNIETPGYDVYTGFGRVNAGAAVQLALESRQRNINTLVPINWLPNSV